MPTDLRFVLVLAAAATLAGIASVGVLYRQDAAQTRISAEMLSGGDLDAGRVALASYNCGACHQIPGIAGANGSVGPALAGVGVRTAVAGVLANNPENMIRWIRSPQAVLPGNGMPDQGVSQRDAQDIAAYLYTLKR